MRKITLLTATYGMMKPITIVKGCRGCGKRFSLIFTRLRVVEKRIEEIEKLHSTFPWTFTKDGRLQELKDEREFLKEYLNSYYGGINT